jgi:hypothetical protein
VRFRRALSALAAGVAATLVFGAQPASAKPAPPPPNCAVDLRTPAVYYGSPQVILEIICNQTVSRVGGGVSLYRDDGVYLGSDSDDNYNYSYARAAVVGTCVTGYYFAKAYVFANYGGAAPDLFQNLTGPTVYLTCP